MRYDLTTRKKPVEFRVINYGVKMENIKFGVLTSNGVVDGEETPMMIVDNSDGGRLISDAIEHENLTEFYFVIDVTDMERHGCVETDSDPIYVVEILAVSPKSVDQNTIDRALDANGPGRDDPCAKEPFVQVESLIGYGKAAHLWQAGGDNKDQLIAEAKKRLAKIKAIFGFYMDQPQNAMGETGWSWISSPGCLKEA